MDTTYEVWIEKRDGAWERVLGGDSGESGEYFSKFKLAEKAAKEKVNEELGANEDNKEIVIVERRQILRLNGPAI